MTPHFLLNIYHTLDFKLKWLDIKLANTSGKPTEKTVLFY